MPGNPTEAVAGMGGLSPQCDLGMELRAIGLGLPTPVPRPSPWET